MVGVRKWNLATSVACSVTNSVTGLPKISHQGHASLLQTFGFS